jgi:predicted bacteriocin transport accessory protein
MKNIKKTDIALVIGVILIIVLGFFVMKGTKASPTYELPLTLEGEAGLQKLSFTEYQEKINNNEEFVVIIERTTCSHCQNFMPVAEEFAKDKSLPMYYIDTDEMEDDEWSDLESSATFFKTKGDNWGTPTVLVQSGKETVDYIEGETDADSLTKLYEKYFDVEKYKND